jgi:hypothetical protein
VALIVAILLLSFTAFAQPKTTLDGIYSPAQSARGKTSYEAHCQSCHAADLTGKNGLPLKGEAFLDHWREFKLNVLVDAMQAEMPLNAPSSLPRETYIEIATYILQNNGAPAGKVELTAPALTAILLTGPEGPKPLPSSSQVSVVGCFVEDSGNGFFLGAADEPARTLDAFQLTAEEFKDARSRSPGHQVFRLENLSDLPNFSTNGILGQRAIAKGILVRQPQGARINIMSFKSLGESCEPNAETK